MCASDQYASENLMDPEINIEWRHSRNNFCDDDRKAENVCFPGEETTI